MENRGYVWNGTSAIEKRPAASVVSARSDANPESSPGTATWMPATGLPVTLSFTLPEIVAHSDVAQSGGIEKSSIGVTSSLVDAAKYPMPRSAKIDQSAVSFAPAKFTRSAWMIAFRMSRNDGAPGESSMARVTSVSATTGPSVWRICQSVSSQISPSACTSGPPATLPKSPYV